MGDLKDKIARLKTLAKALNTDTCSTEGKVIDNILKVLDEFAQEIDRLEQSHEELREFLTSMDEDLGAMEDAFFERDRRFFGGSETIDAVCPYCSETIRVYEEEVDNGEIECPKCHKPIELEWESSDRDDEE